MKPFFRILITLIAMVFGAGIVFALTYVGEKTQGPIEDVFTGAGELVRDAEEKIIINKRVQTRADQLSWMTKSAAGLRNPERILLGAYEEKALTSLKPLFELETALKTTLPLIHIYTAWGSKDNQKFPAIKVESIFKSGSIPVVTWEPWLTDFDATQFPEGLRPVETRDKNGMSDVAAGVYDSYLRSWARAAARIKRPFFLRFGHEMNDPYRYPWGPQHNSPETFVAAWRHVHGIFKQENAGNVIWIWSPHPAYGSFEAYYPGGEYVDWVGSGVLNYGTVAPWSQWWTFDDIFGKYYPALSAFQKPVMICEFGSLAVGGNRQEWYADALADLPALYPQVKALLFFHVSKDMTTTQQALDWSIRYDPDIVSTISGVINTWSN